MTEKTPDFVKRVKKFLPKVFTDEKGTLYLNLTDSDEIRKFGGECIPSGRDRFLVPSSKTTHMYRFGTSVKKRNPVLWEKFHSGRYELKSMVGATADTLFEQPNGILGIKEWTKCHEWYSKKYTEQEKKFHEKNPIWKKIMDLDSEEMKAALDKKELDAMRSLYETQLKGDPDYQSLQDLKQDVFDLDTYVKYLKKQEKCEERKGLRGRLEGLITEYHSDDIKEILPDEKKRLSVRGVMHRKLKKEAGM